MNQMISNRDWVEYSLGDMRLIGFVEDGGEGIYEFNSLDRLMEDRMSLMVHESDIRVLPLDIYKEDIESMIDLALQTSDEDWFNELSVRLVKVK